MARTQRKTMTKGSKIKLTRRLCIKILFYGSMYRTFWKRILFLFVITRFMIWAASYYYCIIYCMQLSNTILYGVHWNSSWDGVMPKQTFNLVLKNLLILDCLFFHKKFPNLLHKSKKFRQKLLSLIATNHQSGGSPMVYKMATKQHNGIRKLSFGFDV